MQGVNKSTETINLLNTNVFVAAGKEEEAPRASGLPASCSSLHFSELLSAFLLEETCVMCLVVPASGLV